MAACGRTNCLPSMRGACAMRLAWEASYDYLYDYLYVTADELPLTFARLMLDMAEFPPEWRQALLPDERPILVGYARADGMEKERVLKAMREIGFRILFVDVDAGVCANLLFSAADVLCILLAHPLRTHVTPGERALWIGQVLTGSLFIVLGLVVILSD